MNERDLLAFESAMQAIDEAINAVTGEIDRDYLGETALARLSTVEAELRRSRLSLEKLIRDYPS
ncbi:hypothetical protein [Rubrobacter indicoceani]|uniref:hypothetical protein n=1 Tax=Rubrobacter indicoceani TaxID=2051957 RepID=UPI000E5B0CF2|nr:hypothetical protein [Rubrobacter indicoceani]